MKISANPVEVERLRAAYVAAGEREHALRTQLAEAHALIRKGVNNANFCCLSMEDSYEQSLWIEACNTVLSANVEPSAAVNEQMFEALRLAREFIVNGVENGYIRMPDVDTPDSAHDTLPKIEAALRGARA